MKRLTILSGHYGAGKSEIAVNLAVDFRIDALVDLDIINPYFRSRSVHALLKKHGVKLVESTVEESSGSDLPYISGEGSRPFYDKSKRAIYDLAGTRAGAKLMMQYRDLIDVDEDLDFFVVVNVFRPETDEAQKIVRLIEDLEGAAQLKVTGLINNSNLIKETEEHHIAKGEEILREVTKQTNIPIVYTFHEASLKLSRQFSGEVRPLRRYLAKTWL